MNEKLDAKPLIDAIPQPPVAKGEWGYRHWYVARKRGFISLGEAVRLSELANVKIETIYPKFYRTALSYEDGEIYRECSRCTTVFLAKKVGHKGRVRTKCEKCPDFARTCAHCNQIFTTPSSNKKVCSEYCKSQRTAEMRRELRRRQMHETVVITCRDCDATFEVKRRSVKRYCDKCAAKRHSAFSKYESPYPMCPSCGKSKSPGRAVCGAEACKRKHKSAKEAARVYKVLPEVIMVLRACPRCDVCGAKFKNAADQCIDHCHETGKIRGVLCRPCNSALGFALEDSRRLRNLADFIERFK